MAISQNMPILIRGLGKQKAAAFVARARQLGMTPTRYLKQLIEEDLAISQRAKTSTFEELLGPGREVDEAELDRLVEEAKVAHYRKKTNKG